MVTRVCSALKGVFRSVRRWLKGFFRSVSRWLYGGEADEAIRFMEATLPQWVANVINSGSEDGADLETAVRALLASPLVESVEHISGNRGGVCAILRCRAAHSCCRSEQRQFTKKRTTLAECADSLLDLINTKHGANVECVVAAEAARAAEATEAGPSAPANAFAAMAAAQEVPAKVAEAKAAETRAAAARETRRELEQKLESANASVVKAEAEVTRLEEEADDARELAGLPRKKQKVEEGDAELSYPKWSTAKWNELETKEQKRRAVEVPKEGPADPSGVAQSIARGDDRRGWHMHWRRGVFGALQSWAAGSRATVVYMLAQCATHFGVIKEVHWRGRLSTQLARSSPRPLTNPTRSYAQVGVALHLSLDAERVKQADTDAKIVDRLRDALSEHKRCGSAEQQHDYLVLLAAVVPEKAKPSDPRGWGNRVSARLGVKPGFRGKDKSRPRAFEKATATRAAFDAAVEQGKEWSSFGLQVGDAATSRGQLCTVLEIDYEADTCKLGFSAGGVETAREYTCIYKGTDAAGKDAFPKGSARLRRAPPSLRPNPRAERGDAKMEKARGAVEKLFDDEGARSPAQRDRVRRRVGVNLYEEAQALMVYAK